MTAMSKQQESKRLVSRTSNKKRTGQWIMSADVPTDVVVEAGGVSFSLHKFPLVARCGRIRKAVAEAREMDLSRIEFPDVPGGAETFELTAKFCYGINFEITASNVAALRCAAEYLEMRDEYGQGNLIGRTEAFISEVVIPSFANSLCVLHSCEGLLPVAEDINLVSRCVEAVATLACKDQRQGSLSGSEYGSSGRLGMKVKPNKPSSFTDWWAEDLSILRIDFYQRVLEAMRARGVREESLWGTLMHYAQTSLKGVNRSSTVPGGRKAQESTTALEHEQRILVETIVSMLPREKNAASCSFLFGLLRTAIILDTTVACRLDIEKRISSQLDQATLDDLLIPSFSYNGDTLFDVDIVLRILTNFLQLHENDEVADNSQATYESDGGTTPTQTSLTKVAKLMDGYLAEIAPDANLKFSKFIAVAELLPEYSRILDDGLYRAVDIYLKAHPNLVEQERKKICRLLNAQKLSQEACCHAAQNDRLPAHFAVQVLYFEQVRIRNDMGSAMLMDEPHLAGGRGGGTSGTVSAAMSPRDNYSSLRRENRELKLEIARMRMRLSELEKSHNNMKQDMEKTTSSGNLVQNVSKRLNWLNPFSRRSSKESDSFSKASEGSQSLKQAKARDRRHSYS